MQSILSTDYYVHFQDKGYDSLRKYLEENFHSNVFILVDVNTGAHCLPLFLEKSGLPMPYQVLEIEAGEEYKNLDTCSRIWDRMSSNSGDRKSLLINLGGGVITDMGGFVASTFKRGIRFINVPTTLLSMVDASVGGKTGVDLGPLKNQIGLFSNPELVLIDTDYLLSLPPRELRSGLAEIIKYGFTFDQSLWEEIKGFEEIEIQRILPMIHRSVEIKNQVVLQDMKETGLRKSLNFGHTIGHAIESYFLETEKLESLTHGEAIAIGMVIELYFSNKLFGFPLEEALCLREFVQKFYGRITLPQEDVPIMLDLMKYDKKNVNGKVQFVLMQKMEKCALDVLVEPELLLEGIDFYSKS